jgi:hypothetical protein
MVWRIARDFGVQVFVSGHRWSNHGRCFIKLLKLIFSRLRFLDEKSYRKVYFIFLLHRITKLQYLLSLFRKILHIIRTSGKTIRVTLVRPRVPFEASFYMFCGWASTAYNAWCRQKMMPI